ncbi:MAG: hypothetical protein IIY53_09085, partial [Solobacterium sp.]|nr:hypothetical protein [Solobacterium sp.]
RHTNRKNRLMRQRLHFFIKNSQFVSIGEVGGSGRCATASEKNRHKHITADIFMKKEGWFNIWK